MGRRGVTGRAAIADAEAAALQAHQRLLAAHNGRLRVAEHDDDGPEPSEAAWSACQDHERHPATGRACRANVPGCVHCGNCVITRMHLPRLLTLLDAFRAAAPR